MDLGVIMVCFCEGLYNDFSDWVLDVKLIVVNV